MYNPQAKVFVLEYNTSSISDTSAPVVNFFKITTLFARTQYLHPWSRCGHYCRFQPTLHPGAFCALVWFWGVTWGIRSSVTSACISVVFLEIESYLKPLSCDTKNVHSGAILRNSVFGVLSLCTRNISLYSQRILMVQHVPEGPFNSVSNDMRYILSCAIFGNCPCLPRLSWDLACSSPFIALFRAVVLFEI